jgi:hypothetical protein
MWTARFAPSWDAPCAAREESSMRFFWLGLAFSLIACGSESNDPSPNDGEGELAGHSSTTGPSAGAGGSSDLSETAGASSTGGAPGTAGASSSAGGASSGAGGKSTGGAGTTSGSGGASIVDSGSRSDATTTFGGARSQCIKWGQNVDVGTPPALVPGVWKQLSAGPTGHFAIDPSNPRIIYIGHQNNGIWKTTDGGSTWKELGTKPDPDPYDNFCPWMDDTGAIYVDPSNPQHLYNANGVDATCTGFWDSTDGGNTWTRPKTFPPKDTTADINEMAVDPCDFKHILTSSHSDWASTSNYSGGIMESTDGGATWVGRIPEGNPWSVGTKGVLFLNDPTTGKSSGKTWLITDNGFWRTSDSGTTWTKVSDAGSPHGTNEFYFTDTGVLYAGAFGYAMRSTDNGLTWTALKQMPYATYYAFGGDGKNLYTQPDGYPPPSGYWVSPEDDGVNWKQYTDTTKPSRGPIAMHFDPVNRILYSSNWDAGLWALKVQ